MKQKLTGEQRTIRKLETRIEALEAALAERLAPKVNVKKIAKALGATHVGHVTKVGPTGPFTRPTRPARPKPAKFAGKLPPNAPRKDVEAMNEAAHDTIARLASKPKHTVVAQKWDESERGWGIRPDGVSLHLTDVDREVYVAEYWREEHARTGGITPDEYSRPGGVQLIDVDTETYNKIKASKQQGLRLWQHEWSQMRP